MRDNSGGYCVVSRIDAKIINISELMLNSSLGISFIVTASDNLENLERCVTSIQGQLFDNIQIIISKTQEQKVT